MSLRNNQQSGFTIVELLIVVVVIAILAAITIVSYTGITQQANASAAESAANSLSKKASLYYADKGSWPTMAQLTSTTVPNPSEPWYVASGTFGDGTSLLNAAPANPSILDYCATAAGARITYWDYEVPARSSDITLGSPTCTNSAT